MTKITVRVDRIRPNQFQARTPGQELDPGFKESIRTQGILEEIAVRDAGGGWYQQAWGHRRLQAVRELIADNLWLDKDGKPTELVEVDLREMDDDQMLDGGAAENGEPGSARAGRLPGP